MAEQVGDISAAGESMDLSTALQHQVKQAVSHRVASRGLNECCKSLDKHSAVLCLLASDINEASYSKLIEALCRESNTPLVKVDSGKLLGEWAGLCKIDQEGQVSKVVSCGCVVLHQWVGAGSGLETIQRYIKEQM